jgi:hypothetical protein
MYTELFKKRVLDAYPNDPELEEALDKGNYGIVAERLRIGSGESIKPEWLLEARTLSQVQKVAAKIVMRNQVYEAFLSEGNVMHASIPCKEQVHKELWDKPEKRLIVEVAPAWEHHMTGEATGYGETDYSYHTKL